LGLCCKAHDNDLAAGITPAIANQSFRNCTEPLGLRARVYSKVVDAAYGTGMSAARSLRSTNARIADNGRNTCDVVVTTVSKRRRRAKKKATKAKNPRRRRRRGVTNAFSNMQLSTAPSAFGMVLRGQSFSHTVTDNGDLLIAIGQEVPIQLNGVVSSSSTWALIGGHRLNPLYFVGGRLATLGLLYEKFVIRKLVCHYVTASPSTTVGDVVLTYVEDSASSYPDPTSANFLTRVLSKPNSVLSSVWKDFNTVVDTEPEEKYIALNQVENERDTSGGDILVYTNSPTVNAGFVVMQYQIELRKALYTPANAQVPQYGDWSAFNPTQATTAVNVAVRLTGFIGFTPGQVWKIYMRKLTTAGTGTTAANAWAASIGGQYTAVNIVEGAIFYLHADTTTSGWLFASYEAAVAGSVNSPIANSNCIVQATASTGAAAFTVFAVIEQFSDSTRIGPN
jgi:hypothetical protein